MDLFLAIDQSTSATKALLFDENSRLLDKASREHAQHCPQPGWVEHDADEIWDNTLATIGEVIRRLGDKAARIRSISITNQRETAVIFSSKTGRPAHRALVWQCRRGAALCEALVADGHEPLFRDRTGLPLDPYFSASKISHLMDTDDSIREGLLNGSLLIGTIDAYLVHRLTGGRVFACDYTNASRTLLFDIRSLTWDETLCGLWNIPPHALPEPRACSAHFGNTNPAGLLPQPVPICGVIGDSHASLFAHRCFSPGSTKVTFGTGSSIMMNGGTDKPVPPEGVVATLAWVHNGTPTYALEGIIISSTATLSWLRSQLGLFESFDEVESLASGLPDNGGVYLVPAFSGLGLPYWKPNARAAIIGLTGHSDKRHLVRAGLESIAYQLRDALEGMQQAQSFRVPSLHGDGGATRNGWLMQFTANVAEIPLIAADMPECSGLGAALMGMLGVGHLAGIADVASLPISTSRYTPNMPADLVSRLHREWQDAVHKTLFNRSS